MAMVARQCVAAWVLAAAAAASVVTRMDQGLSAVPVGDAGATRLNLGYNRIARLPNDTFAACGYRDLRAVVVARNRLAVVEVRAFAGLRRLESVDVSGNRLATLPADAFAGNPRLRQLVAAGNRIGFERQRAFVRSRSLRTLVLSGNRIAGVDDATFGGAPALRHLVLSDNGGLVRLSARCFRALPQLRYLSLADTGVLALSATMFGEPPPRVLRVRRTPLAALFDPPLDHLTAERIRALADLAAIAD